MRIRWLSGALADMRAIRAYIAEQNPVAARQVIDIIRREVTSLTNQPTIGRLGRLPETRELVISPYPYIVAYREHRDEVHILAVVHTSRRWPEQLPRISTQDNLQTANCKLPTND